MYIGNILNSIDVEKDRGRATKAEKLNKIVSVYMYVFIVVYLYFCMRLFIRINICIYIYVCIKMRGRLSKRKNIDKYLYTYI
jgi:hypothetical protein